MSRVRSLSALLAAVAASVPILSRAQTATNTWTGAASTSWSAGIWTPSSPVFGGGSGVRPQFNNTAATTYTATNDLGPFALNGLNLNASSSGTILVNSAPGSALRFMPNGLTAPSISILSSSSGTVSGPLRISSNLGVGGSGLGNLAIAGYISGTGSLSINRNSGTAIFSQASAFTGGTTLNSGTVQFNNAKALGDSTITINGGTLRTLNGSFFDSYNPIISNSELNIAMNGNGKWTFNGPIGGSAGVRNAGLGTLVLRGNSNYAGSTLIEATTAASVSEIFFYNNNNLGAATTPVVFRDATAGTASSALSYDGIGSLDLVHPIQIDPSSEARITPNYTNSTLVLSGGITGQGDLHIGLYPQSGVVDLRGNNTYSGETWITTGTLRFDTDARFGNSNFIILDGGCLMPTGNWTTSRSVTINSNAKTKTSAINTNGFAIDLPAGIDSTQVGLVDLVAFKSGAGSLKLGNILGSALAVNAGDVTLYNQATVSFLSSGGAISPVTLNRGGTLVLDNTANNLADRLPNTGTVSMNGGTLSFRGNAISASTESTGTIALGNSSFNVIELRPAGASGATLAATSLSNPGSAGVLFRANDLGNTSRILFGSSPIPLATGNTPGTPDISVILGGFGDDSADGMGSGFVTYGVDGVRLLASNEYENTITSGTALNRNVSLAEPVSSIDSPTAIQTLRLLDTASVGGNSALTVTTGNILVTSGSTASLSLNSINSSVIHLRNNGTLTLVSNVNATTLNLSGNGVTLASGQLNASSGLNIHEGTLRSAADNIIPDARIVTINDGATWDLNGHSETVAGLTQQNVVTLAAGSYGTMNVNGGVLTLNPGSGVTAVYSGKLTGSGSIVKTGLGSIALNGQTNDFTGQVTIQQGVLRINSLAAAVTAQTSSAESRRDAGGDSILACAGVSFDVNGSSTAELKLSDKISSFARPVVVGGNTTGAVRFTTRNATQISSDITLNRNLQIGAGAGTFSGLIHGNGSITVTHPDPTDTLYQLPPMIAMTSANSYTGSTTLAGGTLLFTADVGNGGASQFGDSTSAIILGDSIAGTKGSELSGITNNTVLSRAIVSGSGAGAINLSGRTGANAGVTFAGPVTLNRTAVLFAGSNPTDNTIGSVAFSGAIGGSSTLTINGNDSFTGQPRQWSNVILSSSLSTINGMTLTTGSLGIGASSAGSTGPVGSGVLTVGANASSTEVPVIYALGAPRSIHNSVVFNTHAMFAGNQPLTLNGPVAIGAVERVIYVEGADVTFNGGVSGTGALAKDGSGTLTLGSTNGYSGPTTAYDGTLVLAASQTPSALNIGSTAKVIISPGANKVLRTANLNMVSGATLDLTDEDAILDYTSSSPLLTTRSRIIQGFNNGSWNGAGIRSSAAAGSANPKTGLGYAEAAVVRSPTGGTFSGASVDGTTVLIRYTALGDLNLNGVVDSVDFDAYLSGYGLTSNALWTDGDFTYDGKVNTLDFNELAGNFGATVAGPVLGSAPLGNVVPEPGMLGFSSVLMLLSGRRARQR